MDSDVVHQEPEVEKPKRGEERPPARKSKEAPQRRSGCQCLLYLVLGCLGSCCLCCVLPLCGTAIFGGAVIAAFDHNKVTATVTQTASVPEDGVITLEVGNTMGDITIQHGSREDQVIVQADKTGYGLTKGAAQDRLDHVKINLTQPDAATVKIEVGNDKDSGGVKLGTSSVKLTISVPERVHVVANTATGTITISGLQVQSLDVESTVGTIEITGPLPADAAAALDVRTTTGEIRMHLPREVQVRIDAETNVGEITVSDGFAKVNKISGSGADSVGNTWIGTLGTRRATPPTLKLRTKVGTISVDVG